MACFHDIRGVNMRLSSSEMGEKTVAEVDDLQGRTMGSNSYISSIVFGNSEFLRGAYPAGICERINFDHSVMSSKPLRIRERFSMKILEIEQFVRNRVCYR